MPAYMIANVKINDPEEYKKYQQQVVPTIQQYDGQILAVEAEPVVVEGEWPGSYTVLIQWPSVERAREWYDSDVYADPKALRHRTASANLVFLRGLPT